MSRLHARRTLSVVLLVTVVVLSGCSQPALDGDGSTPSEIATASTPTDADGPDGQDSTPDATNDSTNTAVTSASQFRRVAAGETAWLESGSENVSISYSRENGTSNVVVDTSARTVSITRDRSASADTVSWSWKGRRFVLEPVDVEERDGQTVYVFGETWNTSHVELEVYCEDDCD